MPGFPDNDHKRVSNATVWVERNKDNKQVVTDSTPRTFGLVRTMLLQAVNSGHEFQSNDFRQIGDFVEMYSWAVVTKPSATNNYQIRAASKVGPPGPSESLRTFRLRVYQLDENPEGILTEPIPEYATAGDVAEAINATGCPPVQVWGFGMSLVRPDGDSRDGTNLFPWPIRVWHVIWPNEHWGLTAHKNAADALSYLPEPDEIGVTCTLSTFEPTPFCELVYFNYPRWYQPTIEAGTIMHCLPLPGQGLVPLDVECWQYADADT